jgi:DNA repair protein RecO (recombination protein O)
MKGIIISENNSGDFDKMLTMLTPGVGKISCVAKGARRPKSSLLAGTQLLCFGEYVMYKGTTTYTINSCEPIEVFYNIRTDFDKLQTAVNVTKIIQNVTEENENCYKILQLYLNTLYTISELDKDLNLVENVFKLKLLCFLGFTPRTAECTNCRAKEELNYFSIKDNGFKCKACGKIDKSSLTMSNGTLNAIKYIVLAPPKKLFSFNLKDEALKEFNLIVNIFFNEKLEIMQ